jgi:hypothetical protein
MKSLPSNVRVLWSIIDGPLYGTAGINAVTGVLEWINSLTIGEEHITVRATSIANPSIFGDFTIIFDINDCEDCNHVQGGTQVYDLCGICGGDSTECMDCLGVPNGVAVRDACGVCNGNGASCRDCFGVQNGGAVLDVCGKCGGDGSTCVGLGISKGGYFGFVVILLFFCGVLIAFGIVASRLFMQWTDYSRFAGDMSARSQDPKKQNRVTPPSTMPTFILPGISRRPVSKPAVSQNVLASSGISVIQS